MSCHIKSASLFGVWPFGILLYGALFVNGVHAQQSPALDQAVDRAIARENSLLEVLRGATPVAETYIQDLMNDSDFGAVPVADHYFLGRIDLSNGISQTSYLPKNTGGVRSLDLFGRFFTVRYLPKGFAQMMLIDGAEFDRQHYDFEFVRKEFLGDARTLVFAVTPHKEAGAGRFKGDIWVEDKGFNIVRFNGTYSGSSGGKMYMHFDSWRTNAGPDLWLPCEVYSEESHLSDTMKIHTLHFKALTKFWGYGGPAARAAGEFTNMVIENSQVEDKSPAAADPSPVEIGRAHV